MVIFHRYVKLPEGMLSKNRPETSQKNLPGPPKHFHALPLDRGFSLTDDLRPRMRKLQRERNMGVS